MNESSDGKKVYWRYYIKSEANNNTELIWSYLSTPRQRSLDPIRTQVGEFHFEFENSKGVTLLRADANTLELEDDPDEDRVYLSGEIPFNPNTTNIVLYRRDIELLRVEVPENRPNLKLKPIKEIGKNELKLAWECKAANPRYLWYSVFLEPEDGKRIPIASKIRESELAINLTDLPGCTNARFKVFASDGVWTTEKLTPTVNILDKPPIVQILDPANGQRLPAHTIIQLQGQGWDRQKRAMLPSESLCWLLDDKLLGSGETYVLSSLSMGQHKLTFQGVDASGLTGESVVKIEAVSNSVINKLI